jgi:hypothetical protein
MSGQGREGSKCRMGQPYAYPCRQLPDNDDWVCGECNGSSCCVEQMSDKCHRGTGGHLCAAWKRGRPRKLR